MAFYDKKKMNKNTTFRLAVNVVSRSVFLLATLLALVILLVLFARIITQGIGYIDWDFFTSFASRHPEEAGIKAAIMGTIWLMAITAPVSIILGVGTAIYLEQYAKKNKFTDLIKINISNLAGVPSIVFGLLGLTVFVRVMEMGRSLLAGGLTMSLLILPIIVVAAQEALRSVPNDTQEASYALGASKWQTVRRILLPAAIPGIMTGSILALSRAIGETAPLLVIGALTFVAFTPDSIWSGFTVMPIQIFNWTSRPQAEFQDVAAAAIIVLLVMLIVMNLIAVLIRNKMNKRY
ncbi:phosphate ABC transporter permease PstA [Virgibacillus sediminis]|uniref:Phosphate transport system permease protein PstA n=1 Tax=Virgibacillus sediminis TaxID=202260 RepID=A0ABV7A1I5_9BACI